MSATRRCRRTFAALLLAGVAALSAGDGRCDDPVPLAQQPLLDRLGRAAVDLAKKGRRTESDETLAVLRDLGAAAKDVDAQRQAVGKALAKAKDAGLPLPDSARTLAKIAADLAAGLATAEGETKVALARQVLRLDGSVRQAHVATGNEEVAGRFVPKAVVPCLARRAQIQDVVTKARRLDVPIVTEESTLGVVARLHGRPGACLRSGDVSFHSADFPAGQVEREMRESLRAFALANWLATGTLEVPKFVGRVDFVFLRTREVYLRSLLDAREHGEISPGQAEAAKGWNGYLGTTHRLFQARGESEIRLHGFFHLREVQEPGGEQTALLSGHLNWNYSNFLGVPMPGVGWVDDAAPPPSGGGETRDTPPETAERKEMARLARAGLQGSRRYLRWLAHRGEDPPWSRSMALPMDKLGVNDLLKCTVVADYLHETGEFAKLYEETRGKPESPATFEALLPGGLAAFEPRWREWLFADEPASGLVQRLGAAPVAATTPAEAAAIRHLDAIRRAAIGPKSVALGIDRDLSDGCHAHAVYLTKHPKQLAAWPDAHEEYPGEDGFTPAGSRAGLESVIDPDAATPEDAIDAWMGTFYHRLPLLNPALLRIGWGYEKSVAVLDSGSLVGEQDESRYVAWPPSGATGVPRRFAPEIPNPVPGQDQGPWGYPVTLQFFAQGDEPDVTLRLYAGARRAGSETPCWSSSPSHPTNPELVPEGSFCLIPKQTLAANTSYTVVASGMPGGNEFVWSFTTGAK